ncbi:NUMOD4 domain-containing protein [Chitinophaga niabensis]|uniref:NUMOD1 domain-containing protein n=1 Tax=Chitinophaga niabensis TaxID=536979 RepID=A0A1N6KAU2_9BACT|nr:NUMOD4 domain-containing protein [Chitinophaga niabensis]SIO53668.1 NUMOD1 domain-containing protein [Chitinophaga niabensis]
MAISTQNRLPAYLDQSLRNRPGEIWKNIKEVNGYYQVSNHGRIKGLEREIFTGNGGVKILQERISKLVVYKAPNKYHKDFTFQLIVNIMVERKQKSFPVRRLVYKYFVQDFDLRDKKTVILVKNGNGFDIYPKNLMASTIINKVRRSVNLGRMVNNFGHIDLEKSIQASTKVTSKRVSQYGNDGKIIKTYASIHEAARITDIYVNSISGVVNGRENTAGGYYWRHGEEASIDIIALKEQKAEHRLLLRGTRVTQYDLKGKFIAYYNSLKDAAKAANCGYTGISAVLRGKAKTAGGFHWVKGISKKRLLLQS